MSIAYQEKSSIGDYQLTIYISGEDNVHATLSGGCCTSSQKVIAFATEIFSTEILAALRENGYDGMFPIFEREIKSNKQ